MTRRFAASALLTCLGALVGCERPMAAAIPRDPTEVVVAPPVARDVTDYEEFTGHTEAILSVEVRSRVTGYLEKRSFAEGEEVKKGDILYEIDNRPYKAALESAESAVARAEAHSRRLDSDYKRASNLFRRGAIGKAEFDLLASNFAESQAQLGAANARRELARQDFGYTKIEAPMGGQISRTLVDPGNLVRQESTILTDIIDADHLYVYFDLNEETQRRVSGMIRDGVVQSRDGKEVVVLVGLSDEEGFSYKAVVNFSENKVDAATGTLRIRGTVGNPRPWILSPGLFVRVRLPIGSPHPTLLVPEGAVGSDQGRSFVYVVDANDQVIYRPVDIGPMFDRMKSIRTGLAAGEKVIVAGLQRVRPGAKVAPRTAPTSKAESGKAA